MQVHWKVLKKSIYEFFFFFGVISLMLIDTLVNDHKYIIRGNNERQVPLRPHINDQSSNCRLLLVLIQMKPILNFNPSSMPWTVFWLYSHKLAATLCIHALIFLGPSRAKNQCWFNPMTPTNMEQILNMQHPCCNTRGPTTLSIVMVLTTSPIM